MEEKIIRPTTKPEAIKGKLLKYQGTDCCEFMPQAQGEPQYGHKRKANIHVFYTIICFETIAHLNCIDIVSDVIVDNR